MLANDPASPYAEPDDLGCIGETAGSLIHCRSLLALSSISLTNGAGKNGDTDTEVLGERERERERWDRASDIVRGGAVRAVAGASVDSNLKVVDIMDIIVGFDGSYSAGVV